MNDPTHRRTDPCTRTASNETSDDATSPVVGVMMMILVAMPTIIGLGLFLDSYQRNIETQRKAAERAKWCTEHPNREWPGEGTCPDPGPRGWKCEEGDTTDPTLKCTPIDGEHTPDNYTVIRDVTTCEETSDSTTGTSTECR